MNSNNNKYQINIHICWGVIITLLFFAGFLYGSTQVVEISQLQERNIIEKKSINPKQSVSEKSAVEDKADEKLVNSVENKSKEITIVQSNNVPSSMVLIPAGSFDMGDTFNEGWDDERTVHSVFVSAFYMDKYEVSKGKWDEVYTWAITNGYNFDDHGSGEATNHPVISIHWYDMVKWCNARSEKEGRTPCYYVNSAKKCVYRNGQLNVANDWVEWETNGYRLPTEAEWEKAARGGAAGHRFPWKDTDTITHSRANYSSSSDYSYDVSVTRGLHPDYNDGTMPYTSPVGSFAPNGYGLYDMAGNVWEWCWDWFDYYSSSPESDPRGPASGMYRVLRGGCWGGYAYGARCASRGGGTPAYGYYGYGFRCVCP
jgi:formylglycine-generating enzyme required for sulfatase activity